MDEIINKYVLNVINNTFSNVKKFKNTYIHHDTTSISKGRVYFYKFDHDKGTEEIIAKLYSKDGFPLNEYAAYKLLGSNKTILRPDFIDFTLLKELGYIMITSKLKGKPLDKLLKEQYSIETNSLFDILNSIVNQLNILNKNFSHSRIEPLIVNYGWLNHDILSIKELVFIGHKRLIKKLSEIIPEKDYIKKHMNWTVKNRKFISDEKLSLCQGDMTANNLIFEINKHNKYIFVGLIDWEYAYFGSTNKDLSDLVYSLHYITNTEYPVMLNFLETKGYYRKELMYYIIQRILTQVFVEYNSSNLKNAKKYLEDMEEAKTLLKFL